MPGLSSPSGSPPDRLPSPNGSPADVRPEADVLHDHALVLFDGVCNLCNGAVNFIIDRDPEGYFTFAALQSEEAAPLLARFGRPPASLTDAPDSIVLIEDGRLHERSAAALRIARRLGLPWSLLYAGIVIPKPLRDALYGWIAANRYRWFGKQDACRIPTPDLRVRFL